MEVQKESEMVRAYGHLSALHMIISELQDRLNPVRSSQPSNDMGTKAGSAQAPLQHISDVANSVQAAYSRLKDLLAELVI